MRIIIHFQLFHNGLTISWLFSLKFLTLVLKVLEVWQLWQVPAPDFSPCRKGGWWSMVSLQILEKQPRLWSSLAGPLIDRTDSNLKPGEIFDNSMSLKGPSPNIWQYDKRRPCHCTFLWPGSSSILVLVLPCLCTPGPSWTGRCPPPSPRCRRPGWRGHGDHWKGSRSREWVLL